MIRVDQQKCCFFVHMDACFSLFRIRPCNVSDGGIAQSSAEQETET